MTNNIDTKNIKVSLYRGVLGIKKIEMKTARIKDSETLIMATNDWCDLTEKKFSESIRKERVANNAVIRELQNPKNFGIIPKSGEVSWTQNKDYLKKIYQHRKIDKKILDISNEILICKNSVYFYSFKNKEIITVEIINREYAKIFKNLFELAWKQAD